MNGNIYNILFHIHTIIQHLFNYSTFIQLFNIFNILFHTIYIYNIAYLSVYKIIRFNFVTTALHNDIHIIFPHDKHISSHLLIVWVSKY